MWVRTLSVFYKHELNFSTQMNKAMLDRIVTNVRVILAQYASPSRPHFTKKQTWKCSRIKKLRLKLKSWKSYKVCIYEILSFKYNLQLYTVCVQFVFPDFRFSGFSRIFLSCVLTPRSIENITDMVRALF